MQIVRDHPYIDEIRFQLNYLPLEIESALGLDSFDPEDNGEYRNFMSMSEEIVTALTGDTGSGEDDGAEYFEDEGGGVIEMAACPWCGSKTRVSCGGRCGNCGGSLDG